MSHWRATADRDFLRCCLWLRQRPGVTEVKASSCYVKAKRAYRVAVCLWRGGVQLTEVAYFSRQEMLYLLRPGDFAGAMVCAPLARRAEKMVLE